MTDAEKVLVYKPNLPQDRPRGEWFTYCDSPLEFMAEVAMTRPGRLVVFVEGDSLKERDAALEFCAGLRGHPATGGLPLVCVLPARHRRLLERLRQAGVDRVAFRPKEAAPPAGPGLKNLGEPLAEVLAQTCPHLEHLPVDRRKEMAYCGAYRSRLVLGRDHLLGVCENDAHRDCPFFMSPRLVSANA
ncbi:MAG: hypothetical protein ACOZHQ_17430 [Thermodesulfobacteriota bacterium]